MRVGVRGNQRRVADVRHVPEAAFVQMRQIEQNPQPVAGADSKLCRGRSGRGRYRATTGSGTARRGRTHSAGSTPGRASAVPPRRARPGARSSRRSLPRLRYAAPPPARPRRGSFQYRRHCGRRERALRTPVRSGKAATPWRRRRAAPRPHRRRAAPDRCRRRRRYPVGAFVGTAIRGKAFRRRRALFAGGEGTNIANRPPAKPPACALGRSRWPFSSPCRNAVTASAPPRRCSRSSTSLWPSKIGMRLDEVTGDPSLIEILRPGLAEGITAVDRALPRRHFPQ